MLPDKTMLLQVFIIARLLSIAAATDCDNLQDGIYDVSCKSYTVCNSGVATIYHCASGTVYDEPSNTCKHETEVGAPCGLHRDCSNMADGNYHDLETNCTSYYTCHGHTYFNHQHCPPGTVFDQSAGYCSWPNVVSPPCGTKV